LEARQGLIKINLNHLIQNLLMHRLLEQVAYKKLHLVFQTFSAGLVLNHVVVRQQAQQAERDRTETAFEVISLTTLMLLFQLISQLLNWGWQTLLRSLALRLVLS